MIDKNEAKVAAREEVKKRIVTKEEAKESFKKWIKESSFNGISNETTAFWIEVYKQIDDV